MLKRCSILLLYAVLDGAYECFCWMSLPTLSLSGIVHSVAYLYQSHCFNTWDKNPCTLDNMFVMIMVSKKSNET